jgi:hypothetical protein
VAAMRARRCPFVPGTSRQRVGQGGTLLVADLQLEVNFHGIELPVSAQDGPPHQRAAWPGDSATARAVPRWQR